MNSGRDVIFDIVRQEPASTHGRGVVTNIGKTRNTTFQLKWASQQECKGYKVDKYGDHHGNGAKTSTSKNNHLLRQFLTSGSRPRHGKAKVGLGHNP